MAAAPEEKRTVGLAGATAIGLGAIVGGGILVLGGVAFAEAGPSALVGFALNGVIALLTALCFAEMSTAFPESGGAYTFAKKVLSVQAAFGVGWVLWFAYIVGAVLYALGFAEYAAQAIVDAFEAIAGAPPEWMTGRPLVMALALIATLLYAAGLSRDAAGGGQWLTYGKVVVFAILIVPGLVAVALGRGGSIGDAMTPFFEGGAIGVLQVMGMTFITVQGFEVAAAVAGEVKQPRRTLPRAMILSLGIALVLYVPLLFVVAAAGAPGHDGIGELARESRETAMAVAVGSYMGPLGYWVVTAAAVLGTLTALQACMLAASRVALAMARDRTLPRVIAEVHPKRATPTMAIGATTLAVAAILFMVKDVAVAGAAAGLIFLVSFALAHMTCFLARRRGGGLPDAYRTPWFPAVPVVGGIACAGVAAFQAIADPSAGVVTAIWLGLGAILYVALFRSRAEAVDAFAEARDPSLARLRGRSPLVLVPVANPQSAAAMVAVANALAPPEVGRVLLLSVLSKTEDASDPFARVRIAEDVLREALGESLASGHAPEALLTISSDRFEEIRRVADLHRCESILLGLSKLDETMLVSDLEELLNGVEADATIVRAPPGWRPQTARRILVPVGGKGGQDELRARLLGSLGRTGERQVTFVQVASPSIDAPDRAEMLRALRAVAEEESPGTARVELLDSDDVAAALLARAADADLVILGLEQIGGRRRFGVLALQIARDAECAVILISRH